jgi:hypothetical protein
MSASCLSAPEVQLYAPRASRFENVGIDGAHRQQLARGYSSGVEIWRARRFILLFSLHSMTLWRKRHALPVLALVLPEVQHLERFAVWDVEQAFARDVDRPAAQVTADPTPS